MTKKKVKSKTKKKKRPRKYEKKLFIKGTLEDVLRLSIQAAEKNENR